MSFVSPNDDHHTNSPDDLLYYAPRSARSTSDEQSTLTPPTRSYAAPRSSSSYFDEEREETFAKFAHPLEIQSVRERLLHSLLVAAAGIAAGMGVVAILALAVFTVLPKASAPLETVSISSPASATPAQVTSEDSQALVQAFTEFKGIQEGKKSEYAGPEQTSADTVKEGPKSMFSWKIYPVATKGIVPIIA